MANDQKKLSNSEIRKLIRKKDGSYEEYLKRADPKKYQSKLFKKDRKEYSNHLFLKKEWGAGSTSAFMQMDASDHFYRARKFAFGSGANLENSTNALGLLTKKQIKDGSKSTLTRYSNVAIPAFALLGMTQSEGTGDFFANWVVADTAGMAGWRAGKSLGAGIAHKLGARGFLALGGAALTGGAVLGAAAMYVAGELASKVMELGKSDNYIRNLAYKIRSPSIENTFENTDMTLTHRQQALQKLSKSALNNRGMMLGNEANIIAGVM